MREGEAMTEKKAQDMQWNVLVKWTNGGAVEFSADEWNSEKRNFDESHLSRIIPEAEARELLEIKAERDKLREALSVAKEALGKCRDLPMPLFIDGVMVATEALARIEEIVK